MCALLTNCVPGEYVFTEPTALSDRVCAPCCGGAYTTGEIVDRLGSICRPIGWTSASPDEVLGPFGGSERSETDTHCIDGEVVTGITFNTIDYLLSTAVTATGTSAPCLERHALYA